MEKRKIGKRLLFLSFLMCAVALWAHDQRAEEMLAAESPHFRPSGAEHIIASSVIDRVSLFHYTPKNIDAALSSQWFEEYFKSLDYNKIYFRQSDLDSFRSQENLLWNSKAHTARLAFAFDVYYLYLQRIREWAGFSIQCLQEEFDFSQEEYLEIDAKERSWYASREEQKAEWRKRVKNDLLSYMLKTEGVASKEAEKGETSDDKATGKEDVRGRLAKNYAQAFKIRNEAESMDVLSYFLNAFTSLFDPHSMYMQPELKEDFDIEMSLSLQGIGATLIVKDMYVTVDSIMAGSPAERCGQLQAGDRIVAVAQDGEESVDIVGMKLSKAVRLIRGKKGTAVHLTVVSEGSVTERVVTIIRDVIAMEEQAAQGIMHEKKSSDGKTLRLLTLYLPSFYADSSSSGQSARNVTNDVRAIIEKHLAEGPIDGMIVDLRGNGGGRLVESVRFANLFTGKSPVVQVRDTRGRNQAMQADGKALYGGPLVVLVDRGSASASEIVSANLQDTGRAIIIGDESTHGKGTVQAVVDLMEDSFMLKMLKLFKDQQSGAIKFTIQKFYRVNGASTQERGVRPDIILPSFMDYMEMGESKLPYCLPWDEISGVQYPTFNFAKQLPLYRKNMDAFLAGNKLYEEYLADLAFFAELRKEKQVPLEINARRRFLEREDKALDMFRKFKAQRKNSRKSASQKVQKPEEAYDIVLEAALAVMAQSIGQPAVQK